MATIKAIEGRSVHQIQSGQVIVDLNSVVKELVENSLDAGATSIDVRFKNHGLDSIEVQDNGKGISSDDFETVALKHHTSKLSSYEDLTGLDTFGFRGEALSSLCALSKFHILTARAEDGAVGKRLDFETSGKLKSSTVAAAQRGTTVTVDEIFCNLPVRRKELEKNIKREYGKVIALLHAYACISVGVRFSVSNQMPKAKKVAVFSTKSNTTTKENIVNVFGAKTLLALVKMELRLEMAPSSGPSTQSARNWSTQATDRAMAVEVLGHISKPIFGEGRQAPDRQMFFVNSRPCQLPQVSRAINEVYKSFNVTQSPFIFANLVMDTNAYDVNVSPDKRTIMLHDQTALLESLKTALTELFQHTDHTVPQSTLPNRKLPAYQPLSINRQASADSTNGADDENEESAADEESALPVTAILPAKRKADGVAKGTPPSLLQGWLGKDADRRSETPAPRKPSEDLSKDKQKLVNHLRKQSGEASVEVESMQTAVEANLELQRSVHIAMDGSHDRSEARSANKGAFTNGGPSVLHRDVEPDPFSTLYNDLFSQPPPYRLPVAAPDTQDAGAVPTSPVGESVTNEADDSEASVDKADGLGVPAVEQQEIPAIAPGSQKATPGAVQNAFDRMRPKKTPLQTAEITVGDTTTTTVIGSSPAYKKRRVYAPDDSQAIAKFGASPLLARGLRNFAAPGSQMEVDSSDMPASRMPRPKPPESASESNSEDDEPLDALDESVRPSTASKKRSIVMADDGRTSDPLDELIPAAADDDEYDEDYIDEREKRLLEDERVARLIQDAEDAAARPTDQNLRRASQVLKNGGNRKDSTLQLMLTLNTSLADIQNRAKVLYADAKAYADSNKADVDTGNAVVKDELNDSNAESKLSLTVVKGDFERMIVVGQFNLGFVLAIRPASDDGSQDELFIIDQHAADEKYNYERLQRTVTLQSQRLVRPKPLELTAIEEEIILNHSDALKANGFEVETTSYAADEETSGRQCRLLTLPISGEKTFELSDLEELLHLLSEAPAGSSEIPRPKKVQRMLAMRACRSSIMVGKTLTSKQMQKVVRHMGEMDKPWNCPHGRPTMRHLAGLGAWSGWQEGDALETDEEDVGRHQIGRRTDWKAWLSQRK